MSQIKQLHPKEGVTLLAVKVPEGAYDFAYHRADWQNEYNVIEWKQPLEVIGSFHKNQGAYVIDDEFDYKVLGIIKDIKEKTWQTIMPDPEIIGEVDDGAYRIEEFYGYTDYINEENAFDTATESAMSLLEKHGVYSKNPIPVPQFNGDYDKDWVYAYEQAQANTGTWVILQRI